MKSELLFIECERLTKNLLKCFKDAESSFLDAIPIDSCVSACYTVDIENLYKR